MIIAVVGFQDDEQQRLKILRKKESIMRWFNR
jgi:hypothetical protein